MEGGRNFLDIDRTRIPFLLHTSGGSSRDPNLERFFSERGSLLLRGSAHAESRRMAGSTGLLGRSCHSAAVHPSSLSFFRSSPYFFFFLPTFPATACDTRHCCCTYPRAATRLSGGGKRQPYRFLSRVENWTIDRSIYIGYEAVEEKEKRRGCRVYR